MARLIRISTILLFLLLCWEVDFTFAQALEVPTIITRTQWGADESIRSWEPEYPTKTDGSFDYQAKKIVIHHTASLQLPQDTDGTGQYKAKIRDIYRFHVFNATWEEYPGLKQRGFGDIGYHYLIDPAGFIYQGRIGNNGVIGAHVYGFNKGTIGIAILGTYGVKINGNFVSQEITEKTKDSLAKLIGWLAAVNSIDLKEKSEICGKNIKGEDICKSIPGLVGHGELTQTLCPGEELQEILDEVRKKAESLATIYKGYLYQEQNKKTVYRIQAGTKESFKDLSDFLKQGGQYQKLVQVPKTLLDIFPIKIQPTKYPDGSLLREFNSNEIFLIENGKKRKFEVQEEEFKKLGFDFSQIRAVSFDILNQYENGPKIIYGQDGSLLTFDGLKIYFVERGRKRLISSHTLFEALKFKVPDIKKVLEEELSVILDGEPMKYPDGTLLKAKGFDTVYLIDFGKKRKFWSLRQFLSLGYKWEKVLEVEKEEVLVFEDGPSLRWPSGTLLRAEGTPEIYLIIAGERNWIKSAEEFFKKGFKWSDVITVSREELLSYPTASGKIQDGSLVKSEERPEIYLVEGTKLYWIKSPEDFEAKGYRWSDVITVNQQTLAKYSIVTETIKLSGEKSKISETLTLSSEMSTKTPEPTPQPTKIGERLMEPRIRIAIFSPEIGHRLKVTANNPYEVYLGEKLLVAKKAGQQTTYLLDKDVILKFISKDPGTIFEILSYEDRPFWKPEINYNKFRGLLEVKYSPKSKKIWVINELLMEDYLRGQAEAVQGDPLEFLKALSVAARSYSLFHLKNNGKYGKEEIFHLKNTASDQLYKGYAREEFAPDIVKAVEETRGLAIYFDNFPARAVYSSGSPEPTRDACKVWAGEFCEKRYDYLRGGVTSPVGSIYKYPSCAGINHCVGLMADGARHLAKEGKNWQEILKYYYLGIEIKKAY